jgi:hypothetical protein
MKLLLFFIILLSLLLCNISCGIINSIVSKRKIERNYWDDKLLRIIPFYSFHEYVLITKNEKGKIGIWCWLSIMSYAVSMVSLILFAFLEIFYWK